MIEVSSILSAFGSDFHPSRVDGVSFTEANDPGETGRTGKYKGVPTPYGSAEIHFDSPPECPLLALEARQLQEEDTVGRLRNAGATDITLYVSVEFQDQCNFEIEPSVLASLATQGITVAFSCYPADPDPVDTSRCTTEPR
jgi:hypothetical protein